MNITSSIARSLAFAAVAFVSTFASLNPARADDSNLSSKDKSFIQDAYQDGLGEVKQAELAQQKTANPDVKAFAAKIATDHSAANAKLKMLADSKKVSTANDASMMAKGKGQLLDAKSGGDFDKAYIDGMISDHKKDIEAFEKAANEAQDQDVKNFASQTLPTLKEHLSAAESIQAKIGK